jgi:hypothetical protein
MFHNPIYAGLYLLCFFESDSFRLTRASLGTLLNICQLAYLCRSSSVYILIQVYFGIWLPTHLYGCHLYSKGIKHIRQLEESYPPYGSLLDESHLFPILLPQFRREDLCSLRRTNIFPLFRTALPLISQTTPNNHHRNCSHCHSNCASSYSRSPSHQSS